MMERKQLEAAQADLRRSTSLSPYEAIDVAWVAVVKLANLLPGSNEHSRLLALLKSLCEESVRGVLADRSVDQLLELDPPLESILVMPHERLYRQRTAEELRQVKELRDTDPKRALASLAEVLKRVRNRRAHGFKTPQGSRDEQILSAAVRILQNVGSVAAQQLSAH